MKFLVGFLIILFLGLQYKLWFESTSVSQAINLKKDILKQTLENENLKNRNDVLFSEVQDLKNGRAAIEERARNELGMIKPDETFYQIVVKPS